jgi:acyl-coenzyme A thioesterase PaaI-like protein
MIDQLIKADEAARTLGIVLVSASRGEVELAMPAPTSPDEWDASTFFLADTAFAYACVSAGFTAVTHHMHAEFIDDPSMDSTELRALARLHHSVHRTVYVGVDVLADQCTVAEFRATGAMIHRNPSRSEDGRRTAATP